MTDADCMFCGIVAGDEDALVVDETAETLAFAPLDPVAPGHVLVVPKAHYESLFDVSDGALASVAAHAKALATALCKSDDAGFDGANLLHDSGAAAGQAVRHLHVHVVGRRSDDGVDPWPATGYDGDREDAYAAVTAALDGS